jgi:hypothetical protein
VLVLTTTMAPCTPPRLQRHRFVESSGSRGPGTIADNSWGYTGRWDAGRKPASVTSAAR